jgi:hypothetical protein
VRPSSAYTSSMRIEPRVLLLAGVLLAIPSWVMACEQKLDVSATASSMTVSAASSITASATACSARASERTTCSIVIAKGPASSRAAKKARRHWSPGHLVEPDSMRLAPEERNPGEQWVVISSRTGTIQVHRTPWAPKKSDSHNAAQTARHS